MDGGGFATSIPQSDAEFESNYTPGRQDAPIPFWDSAKASLENGLANQTMGARENYLSTAYLQRDNDIARRTGERVAQPSDMLPMAGDPQSAPDYWHMLGGSPDVEAAYEAKVDALRLKYPSQMAGVQTATQLRAQVDQELQGFASRAAAGGQQHPVGSFLGGAAASFGDPLNLALGVTGVGEAAPLAMRVLMQGGMWSGLMAGEAPFKALEAGEVGGPAYGVTEALGDIAGGAAAGAGFTLLHGLLKGPLGALIGRAGEYLRGPEGDAERGALNVLDGAGLDSQAIGPLRGGADFEAGQASLDAGAPPPAIEPSRDLGDLFGEVTPAPGPARDLAGQFSGPEGAALYERSEYRGRAIYGGTFDPAKLATDPATFQYKSGGDAAGVTDRLKGVQAWDPTSSGKIIAYEGEDGALTIADGHQRLGLATRLEAAGFEPRLDGYLFRATDGWSPQDVRVIAALKNIREGQGNPLDAAKVLREAPGAIIDDSLPVSGDFIRQAKGLARLNPDAFGAVINKVIPERQGALIGELAGDRPDLHSGLVKLLHAGEPANQDEAHALIQEGLLDEWIKGQGAQSDLFGDSPAQSVAIGRAKLRAWLLKSLRGDTRLYGQLVRHADAIEAGGNTLARDANEASLAVTNTALESIAKLGMRSGELGDAMNEAARRIAAGEKPGDVGKGILARVKAAIANGERIDEARAGTLNPAAPTAPAEKAAAEFSEVGGKGMREQLAEKPEDVREPPGTREPLGTPGTSGTGEPDASAFHPSLFDDIPGAERESAALDHLKACAPGDG
jgi:hypothetical protein